MLVEHERHGETTYTSEPTEEMKLDPRNSDDTYVLRYTDTRPMAGMYLYNAKHNQVVRDQVDLVQAYQQADVLKAQKAWKRQEQGRHNRVPGE